MVQNRSNIGPIWSDLVPNGRIWSQMVGFGPKSGQQKSKKTCFPKCPKIDWKWFLWPLGVLGTCFYYVITSFYINIRDFFFSYYLLPLFPCIIPYSLSGSCYPVIPVYLFGPGTGPVARALAQTSAQASAFVRDKSAAAVGYTGIWTIGTNRIHIGTIGTIGTIGIIGIH